MSEKGVGLIEIVVSMILLAVCVLAATATISMVSGKEHRSAGGSSLDLQALSFARETVEQLKNAVSTNSTTALKLSDNSYTAPCATAIGVPCGAGQVHSTEGLPLTGLPAGSDLLTKVSGTSTRTYKVWDISSGTNTVGTDVAYKKVTVTVAWTDPA
ncbi:MAG: hypothetical protein WC133_02870 [Candidatus Omnitrophota bacterium]